jgi:hypothetical protein
MPRTASATAHVDKLGAAVRVANSPRSRVNPAGQIRPFWREESVGEPRSTVLRNLEGVGENGQASLNSCGVRPVQGRNDRGNAAGSEYWRRTRWRRCSDCDPEAMPAARSSHGLERTCHV